MRIICTILFSLITTLAFSQEVGMASYYHNKFHGRKMANGQRYDKNLFTCAHRTYPFGTKLRLTNIKNGKSVKVTVTDRGPFVRYRVLDISLAAAQALGMKKSGVASIRIDVEKSSHRKDSL